MVHVSYLRIKFCGRYCILRKGKQQKDGENYIIKSFIIIIASLSKIITVIKSVKRWVGHITRREGIKLCNSME
jgi:hypothetical protein